MNHPGFDPPADPYAAPATTPPVEPPFSPAAAEPPPMTPPPMTPPPMTPPTPPPPPAPPAPPAPFAAEPAVPAQPTYAPAPAAEPATAAAPPLAGPGQPAYAPGSAGIPAPPTYDAAAAQAYSAQPYSAAPYSAQPYPGQPYSAPPVSGAYPYPVPAVPPKRGRAGTVVLAILTALFLVAAGVFGTLFFMRNSEANKLQSQVTQLSTDFATQKTRADGLQRDLENTKRDLSDAKSDSEEIVKARAALAACINAINDYFSAVSKANGQSTADTKAKGAELDTKCDAAEKYL